ncbi:MAG: indole-3-glycerol-phosphate synthase, partial [Bacteroidota bacterium]
KALREREIAVIAEIKKVAQTTNVKKKGFDPLAAGREFVNAGATALSVVTDEKFFLGKLELIERMRDFITVPIVGRDFIIDPYQLYEAKAYGGDAVFLLAAVLDTKQLHDLAEEATSLGLESVVEVRTEDEIEALDMSAMDIISINNRNPDSFETDIYTSVRLKKFVPNDKIIVSECGIETGKDIDLLMSHGIHAFVVGEPLLRVEEPGRALAELLHSVEGVRSRR